MGLSTFDAFKSLAPGVGINIDDTQLRQLQLTLLEILKDIDDICRTNKIEYQLGGGSCLGAVRHKGFIPWDDDADVNMPREGYERFAKIVRTDPTYSNRYWLHDPKHTKHFDLAFGRIRLKNTTYRTRDDLNNDEAGVFVDIFFADNVPNNSFLRQLHGLGSLTIGFLYSCRRFAQYETLYKKILQTNPKLNMAFTIKKLIGTVLRFAPTAAWCRAWDRWNGLYKNEDSNYLTYPAGRKHYFGELARRSELFPARVGVFEGHNLNIANNTNAYLARLYGNYMAIPKDAEKEQHVVFELVLKRKSTE